MGDPEGHAAAPVSPSPQHLHGRPRSWETVVLSGALAVPPVLLVGFWLTWHVRDLRAQRVAEDGDLPFDPHGFLLLSGSVLLLGLLVLVGLVLLPWTVRLVRRRGRAVWLPVVLTAVDLVPLPVLAVVLAFLLVPVAL